MSRKGGSEVVREERQWAELRRLLSRLQVFISRFEQRIVMI